MKTKSSKDGVIQNQKENQSLFRALVALLGLALAACSSVDKDPVTPVDVFSQPIGRIELQADTTGKAIISTSNGLMSHVKATKLKKGGEILCFIG